MLFFISWTPFHVQRLGYVYFKSADLFRTVNQYLFYFSGMSDQSNCETTEWMLQEFSTTCPPLSTPSSTGFSASSTGQLSIIFIDTVSSYNTSQTDNTLLYNKSHKWDFQCSILKQFLCCHKNNKLLLSYYAAALFTSSRRPEELQNIQDKMSKWTGREDPAQC